MRQSQKKDKQQIIHIVSFLCSNLMVRIANGIV